jgi:DNA-binding CsgD family transcriptional regulator
MPGILERNRLKVLQLTPRQKQCVDLLARGYSPKEIAAILYIEPRTVNYHLYCVLQRFEARTYPQLIYYLAELDYFKE